MSSIARQGPASKTDHPAIWNATSRVGIVSLAVGTVSFLVTEVMHYLLVPDIGRLRERLLAEGLSAIVVALLTAGLLHTANQKRKSALLRMQVISEMNHHIRNALAAISLTTDSIQNRQCIGVILESVARIDWTLREILPRSTPLPEREREHLWFFRPRNIERGIAEKQKEVTPGSR
jgi:signal transduction histidine kinase